MVSDCVFDILSSLLLECHVVLKQPNSQTTIAFFFLQPTDTKGPNFFHIRTRLRR
jgi:hypothetical protein